MYFDLTFLSCCSFLTQTHFLCHCLTFLPRGSHDISDRLIILLSFPVYCGLYGKVKYEMLLTHFPNMVYGTLSEIEIALFAVCGMEATIYYRMQN